MKKLLVALSLLGIVSCLSFVVAQPPADDAKPEKKAAEERDSYQLPDGYSAVVTKKQRTQIYNIQKKYQGEIDELRKQIEALEKTRDKEVANVLDDEQKRIIAYILKLREKERAEEEGESSDKE